MYDVVELITLVGWITIFVLWMAVLAYKGIRRGYFRMSNIVHVARRISGKFRSWCKGKGLNEVDIVVQQEVNNRLEGNMIYSVKYMRMGFGIMILTGGYRVAMQKERWMSPVQDLCVTVIFILCLGVEAMHRVPFSCWARAWYSTCYASTAMFAVSSKDNSTILSTAVCTLIVCLALVASYPRPKLAGFWIGVTSYATAWKYLSLEDASLCGIMSCPHVMLLQTCIFCFLLVMCIFLERSLLMNASREVKFAMLEGEKSAMQTMLFLMCDVVVELDSDLGIKTHEPRLLAMFTLGASKSTEGMRLQQFMDPECARRFESRMFETVTDESFPGVATGAMHLNMKDSMGAQLNVEVFHVRFPRQHDKCHYFIGIREFTDWPTTELKGFSRQHPAEGRRMRQPRARTEGKGTQHAAEFSALPVSSRSARVNTPEPSSSEEEDKEHVEPALNQQTMRTCSGAHPQAEPSVASVELRMSSHSSACSTSSEMQFPTTEGRLLRPTCQPTSLQAIDCTVLQAMSTWNVIPGHMACCQLHGALLVLEQCMLRLEDKECVQSLLLSGEFQCNACGILLRTAEECPLCNGQGLECLTQQQNVASL